MYEIFRKPQSVYNIFSANEKTANRNERKALTERIAFYDAVLDILAPRSAESASAAEDADVAEPQTEVETTTETTSFIPGLVEDEYTAKLSGKRRKALHDVAVALGLRVRFVDAVRTAAGGLANADISGNEVRIAWSKRDKAISFLVGHEFTHRMQELSPKEYASFKESVKAYMGDERRNALVAKTRSIYEAHNAREMARAEAEHRAPRLLQYSIELIEDEVVADFAGELNEDANALAAFAEKLAEKPSTLKAVIAVLRDILNKLKGLVAGAEAQRLANMLSKFEELYRASASRTTEGQAQGKEKYSLIGEQGAANLDKAEEATTRFDNLAVAREMETASKDVKAIKLATGWERGADGLWRYEIMDDEINQNAIFNHREDGVSITLLGELLGGSELLKAYPQLDDMVVVYQELPLGTLGGYSPANKMGMPANIVLSDMFLSRRENPKWRAEVKRMEQEPIIKAWSDAMMAEPYDIKAYENAERTFKSSPLWDEYNNLLMGKGKYPRLIKGIGGREALLHEVQHAIQDIEGFAKGGNTKREHYNQLAGEVEARNVEKRANMSMAERLASLAEETEDVARKDQIILREGVEMAMAGKKRGATKSNTSKLGQPTTANGNPPVAYLGTKLNKNYESAIADIENKIKAKGVLSGHEFLHELDNALTGLNEASTDGSDYVDIGDGFTIRVSDHYSNANTFKRFNNTKKNFGIVIKLKNRKFKSDPNVDYVEVVYYPDKLDGNRQLSILDGVKKLVKTKDIGEMPAPDDTHTSEDIRHSLITPELDATYLDAVERGDMETAQRMVLEAAKLAMPYTKVVDENGNPKVVYHQTNASVYINRETGQNWDELDWRERMEWDERNDWDDYWEEREFNTFSRVNARTTNEFDGFFFAPNYDEYHEYGDRTIAAFLNITNPASNADYNIDSSKNNAGREERLRLQREGYDGVIREYDGEVHEYIAFNPNQIKSADPVTYDDNGDVIPLSERFNPEKKDIRYSISSQPIFYSNAEYAVRGIKQEKATPEQWLKMIEKNGGLKAGEDKWLGLSDWLKASDKKTLTKDEVLQYIAENDIQIEEVEYAQFGPGLIDEATRKLEAEMREIGIEAMRDKYDGFDDLFEVYNGELLWSEERASEGEYEDFIIENNIVDVNAQANAINETRLGYTTNGLNNKREIALTVPTIEPWNTSDNIHFGDAGEGRAVAWIRFGETTDADGKRVLVIDEIQSKRHQEGRDKGYSDKRVSQQELYDAQEEAFSKVIDYESALADKYGEDEWASLASEEEMAEYERLRAIDEAATNAYENYDKGIPSAPFEKNWAELAMKRMLRYAAENGFDKVAWTTGDQQAERYGMHKAVSKIVRRDNSLVEGKRFLLVGDTIVPHKITVSDEGIIVASTIENIEGKALSEVMGKEVALKMMQMGNEASLESANLRIGGEGMKAFYDQMLPSFVRKYAKKWGATVGEVTMPDLEKNNTMHSVDVTPAMRESVMQGQPKFSLRDAETEKIFTAAKEKFGTTYDMREAGYILPDGSMLDFSGKHKVRDADTSFLNGGRTVDHREIEDIAYDFDGNETGVKTDLGDFLDRGAIRIDYNAGAINLNIAPTRAQKDRLKRLIERNDGYVYIDFGKGWDTEHYAEYEAARASRVLGDIDRYFDEGIKPTGNVRFSLSEVNDRRFSMPMPDDIFFDDNGDIITFGGDDVREATTIVRRTPKTTEERIKMYMESRHYDSQRVSSGSFI